MEIQKIETKHPIATGRIETGPLQINDDWPGTFIRGDNSLHIASNLSLLLRRLKIDGVELHPFLEEAALKEAIDILGSCCTNPAIAPNSNV